LTGTVFGRGGGVGSKVARPETIRASSASGSSLAGGVAAAGGGFRSLSGRTESFGSYRSAINARPML
jgi:hypothetical protein